MLKKEAMVIKERLNKDDLTSFTASNGLLEMFKFRDDDDITIEDFKTSTSPGQINTDLVDQREKTWQEAIEDVVPNDLDSNEDQNPEVISDDEDHEDTVRSELKAALALQHLDQQLEFSIAKNDETLSGLLSMINTIENIKIPSL